MKSKLLIMAALCAITVLTANAQTKGTNALSLGLNFSTQDTKNSNSNGTSSGGSTKNNFITFGYGHFFKDNEKIALDLSYGSNKSQFDDVQYEVTTKDYGAFVTYQKYLPVIKKLYAHIGGRAGYMYSKNDSQSNTNSFYRSSYYAVGAYGGVSYFLSKRFALETNILSAEANYGEIEQTANSANSVQRIKNSNFNLNSGGAFGNLGFKIYLLF